MQRKLLGIIGMDFDETDQLLTIYSAFIKYRISWAIGRTFFPEKCDLKSTCVLYAEGKYLFPNL